MGRRGLRLALRWASDVLLGGELGHVAGGAVLKPDDFLYIGGDIGPLFEAEAAHNSNGRTHARQHVSHAALSSRRSQCK